MSLARHVASLLLAATSVLTLGCTSDADDPVLGGGGAGGKADSDTPVVRFADDWSESVEGELLAGSPMRITYDLDRLQECRGSTNGSEVWGVSGFASFDGGEPVAFALSRIDHGLVVPVTAEVEIPAGTDRAQLWFTINNRWGCIAYDSNHGANYELDVTSGATGPVLAFDADGSETVSAPLRAGETVTVHYDPARLAQCEASRYGTAAWSVTMHYRVDGGVVKTLLVTRPDGPELVASDASLTLPRGSELEVWFSASSVYGCNAYDSNLGVNYRFAID